MSQGVTGLYIGLAGLLQGCYSVLKCVKGVLHGCYMGNKGCYEDNNAVFLYLCIFFKS